MSRNACAPLAAAVKPQLVTEKVINHGSSNRQRQTDHDSCPGAGDGIELGRRRNLVKMAGRGQRFDLSADVHGPGRLRTARSSRGTGLIERMNWVAESDRPCAGYTVNSRSTATWGWRCAGGSVRARPKRHGHASALMGPVRGGFQRGGLPAGGLAGRPRGARKGRPWPTAASRGRGPSQPPAGRVGVGP